MVFENTTASLSNMWSQYIGNYSVVVLVLITVLLFLGVIIYIVLKLKVGNKTKVKRTVYRDVLNVSKSTGPAVVSSADLLVDTPNFTYSFWMYVDSHVQTPGLNKLVFYRGEKDNIVSANPIIMMDEISNKMYIVLKTKDSRLEASSGVDYRNLKDIIERNYFLNKSFKFGDVNTNNHIIFEINSVPMSRWVHFAVSVSDNVVTIFVDGEIYAVKTVDDFTEIRSRQDKTIRGELRKYDLTIDKPSNGDLFIGKNDVIARGNSINGYLSKFDVFNHGLSLSDIQNIYLEGPVHQTWLDKWGLAYRLRSPVYKKIAA